MTTTFKCFGWCALVTLLLPAIGISAEQKKESEDPVAAVDSQAKADDYDLDPKKWGIQNNCIRTNRIRKISFYDDQFAIVQVSRKKYILMTLRRPCRGVMDRGISYKSNGGTLCARFDHIKVLGHGIRDFDSGISCRIESFEPYLLPLGDDGLPMEEMDVLEGAENDS